MALSITCKRCGKTHEVEKLRGKEEQYVCPRCFFGDLSAVTKGEWTEVGSVRSRENHVYRCDRWSLEKERKERQEAEVNCSNSCCTGVPLGRRYSCRRNKITSV